MKKLIPADTVDANGTVWETTGENIRNGEKRFSENEIKAILDIIFPVGSVYCGDNPFILSVGKWNQIKSAEWNILYLGGDSPTGTSVNTPGYTRSDNMVLGTVVRIWKRVG